MTSLLLVPMFGLLGLVTDIGYMHYVKESTQAAAEAAAWSAVVDFHATTGGATYTCGGNVVCQSTPTACTPSITTPQNSIEHGCMYAQAHGFNGAGQVTYQSGNSSTPPTAPGMGTAPYWVTFRVAQRVPQLFSAILGNTSGMVVARSTGTLVGATDCIYALNRTVPSAISIGGTASLTSACGIYDNSSATCALSTNGGGVLSAPEYDVVGTACTQNPLTPTPNAGVAPTGDPLAGLPAPASAPYTCNQTYPNGNGNGSTINLQPGVYCGGIQVQNNTANFAPGTYILVGGGLTTQDTNSHITGSGVTIYNTFDPTSHNNSANTFSPININANSSVNLTATTTGTYAGILFFDDRAAPTGNNCGNGHQSCADNYGGGSSAVYQGTIYDRNNGITLYGNSSLNAQYTIVVADTISLVGTSGLNDNYSTLPGGTTPLQQVAMVE
jgi:hypothetical protein